MIFIDCGTFLDRTILPNTLNKPLILNDYCARKTPGFEGASLELWDFVSRDLCALNRFATCANRSSPQSSNIALIAHTTIRTLSWVYPRRQSMRSMDGVNGCTFDLAECSVKNGIPVRAHRNSCARTVSSAQSVVRSNFQSRFLERVLAALTAATMTLPTFEVISRRYFAFRKATVVGLATLGRAGTVLASSTAAQNSLVPYSSGRRMRCLLSSL